ncbi:polymorphic toxin type 37 domain-containing protein [Stenotrophomonas lactitubi]|uniref:polymorphic toxin type 37 domain-containing protein n=1 Tax=Stenotrophomonas lactitubi TaxID=2045214 RepID=UPI003DA700B3
MPELAYIREPKDARDPNGAKAPGLPGEPEGSCPGKDGQKWVRAPKGRGYGWEDIAGDAWVPTGPATDSAGKPHGEPHWMCRASEIQSDTRMSIQVD